MLKRPSKFHVQTVLVLRVKRNQLERVILKRYIVCAMKNRAYNLAFLFDDLRAIHVSKQFDIFSILCSTFETADSIGIFLY